MAYEWVGECDEYVPSMECAICGCGNVPCHGRGHCDWCDRAECDVCGCSMTPTYEPWERCQHCFDQCIVDELVNWSPCRICGCGMPHASRTVCDACQIRTEVRYATPRCYGCRTAPVAASGTLCETCSASERAATSARPGSYVAPKFLYQHNATGTAFIVPYGTERKDWLRDCVWIGNTGDPNAMVELDRLNAGGDVIDWKAVDRERAAAQREGVMTLSM